MLAKIKYPIKTVIKPNPKQKSPSTKLSFKLFSNEEISKKLKNLEIENEKLNKNIEEENEEKNEQINELVSKINDYELQIKNIKFDYDEKKLELKKLENNVKI